MGKQSTRKPHSYTKTCKRAMILPVKLLRCIVNVSAAARVAPSFQFCSL